MSRARRWAARVPVGRLLLLAWCCASSILSASSFAEPAAGPGAADVYEQRLVQEALAQAGLSPTTPAPAEPIAFIHVVREPVFTPQDPWPDVFNVAHWLTEDEVVRRELRFAEGEPWSVARVLESERNLRRLAVFSLVRIVPVRRADGRLGVLVFTRDLWSLRLEQGFQITGAQIDRLALALTERNLLGRTLVASARLARDPVTTSVGEVLLARRIVDGTWSAVEAVDVTFNNATGALEGSAGTLSVGRPLWNLQQPWALGLDVAYDVGVSRQLQGGVPALYDVPETAAVERIPRVWSARSGQAGIAVTRQHGGLVQRRLTLGFGFTGLEVEPHAQTGALTAQERVAFARDVLPVARRVLGPSARLEVFTPHFKTYENLDTFGQSEPVRLGPALSVGASGGLRAALSSSDTVLLSAAAGLVDDVAGGLVDLSVETVARLEDGQVVNRVLALRLRAATTPVLLGRLALRLDWTLRQNDVTNALVTLGGDNGLRGYPSQAFAAVGASVLQGNVEWRSLPVVWQSVHLGLVAFYDVGALHEALTDLTPRHSMGVGVRVLFPQFNRLAYRVDVGVPLGAPGFAVLLSLGDTQAFSVGVPATGRLDFSGG